MLVPSAKLSDKCNVDILAKIFQPVVDFVLPPRCAVCGVIVSGQGGFCTNCWSQMHFVAPPWCASCGLPLPYAGEEEKNCGACLAEKPVHDGIRAAVAYDDNSREIVLKLKYSGKIGLANLVAEQLVRHLPEKSDDLIMAPVPLHWTRLWARSYNQSALIANALSAIGEIQNAPDMLIRKKKTEMLRGKNEKERRKEVSNAFAINAKWADDVAGRHILLIDDVYTSGATSEACVKILKAAGASKVEIFCWARVLRDENLHSGSSAPQSGMDMAGGDMA